MATSIAFNDGAAASVTNSKAVPGDRLRGWLADADVVGPTHARLSDGQPYSYEHRTDYTVRFSIPYIPQSSLDVVLRFIRHLKKGGVCTVNTGDSSSRSYSSMYMKADSPPLLSGPDPRTLEYELMLTLVNTAGAQMLCTY